jgi:outer membrane receptor protein involved in Fe transport
MNRTLYNYEDGEGWSGNYVGLYQTPRLNAVFNADWRYRDFVTSLFVNYTGGRDWKSTPEDTWFDPENCAANAGAMSPGRCKAGIPSFTTVNFNLDWNATPSLRVGLNVQNIFNRQPYYDPNGYEGFNHRHNIFGRIYTLSASYRFF